MIGAAVIGSGNIGTDLMIKLLRGGGPLRMRAMAGIDPASDGLARAARLGVATTADGVDGLLALPRFAEIGVVFDATSASAHEANAKALAPYDVRVVDLTPAALGPFGYRRSTSTCAARLSAIVNSMLTCAHRLANRCPAGGIEASARPSLGVRGPKARNAAVVQFGYQAHRGWVAGWY